MPRDKKVVNVRVTFGNTKFEFVDLGYEQFQSTLVSGLAAESYEQFQSILVSGLASRKLQACVVLVKVTTYVVTLYEIVEGGMSLVYPIFCLLCLFLCAALSNHICLVINL